MKCFIFGAGAERGYGLSEGYDFAKSVLGIDVEELTSAVDEYYKNNEFDSWYPKYNKNCKWNEKQILRAAAIKEMQDQGRKVDYSNKKTADVIRKRVDECKEDKQKKKEILSKYASYVGLIDSRFYTLMNPKALGPNKFWSVVSAYTRAYCYLMGQILYGEHVDQSKYIELLENPDRTYNLCKKKCIEVATDKKIKTYYSCLKEWENKGNDFRIITTNYTPFISELFMGGKCAYLNGKFGWYESVKNICTYDIEDDDVNTESNDLLFPYIFVQSGVKPIVDGRQLKEYSLATQFLDECDEICIVGYGLNEDDNHINSLIASAIRNGARLTFFNYESKNEKEDILKKLRLSKRYDNDIALIDFTSANALDIFKGYLFGEQKK